MHFSTSSFLTARAKVLRAIRTPLRMITLVCSGTSFPQQKFTPCDERPLLRLHKTPRLNACARSPGNRNETLQDRYRHSGTANSLFRNILPLKPLLLIFCGPTRGLLGRKANEMKILQIRSKNCRTRISTLATSLLHSSVCRRDVARNVSMHLKELFMRRLLLSLLVFAFALPVLAQAKHPFTFDDMMKLKRVGDPQVSPDGKWVIFSVVDVDLAANTKTPHIWIVPLNGEKDAHVGTAAPGRPAEQSSASSSAAERVLIADQDGDRPRWAPDGKRFAFISNKGRRHRFGLPNSMARREPSVNFISSRLSLLRRAGNCGPRTARRFFLHRMFIPNAREPQRARPPAILISSRKPDIRRSKL